MTGRRSIAHFCARPTALVIMGFALALAVLAAPLPVHANGGFEDHLRAGAAGDQSRHVKIGVSKSLVVDLPRGAADVIVADPEVADAVVRSARRAFIIGREVGQTNVFFFDRAGNRILHLEVQVEHDVGVLNRTIASLVPGSSVRAEPLNDNVVLTGSVASPADAQRAVNIARRFVDSEDQVLNLIDVAGDEQVAIRVTVAEVERSVIKQLGINLRSLASTDGTIFDVLTENPFTATGSAIAGTRAILSRTVGDNTLQATLRALEQKGFSRTLAEPTLTAVSGEEARFLAGGEFPVPTARDEDGNISLEYKPFGVTLEFTPVVLSEGRISLTVKTEVSELTSEGAFTLAGGVTADGNVVNDLTIPALKVRRASSTFEMPSGGALGIAGLIQEETRQNVNGVPGLMDLPILGTLFRSRDFITSETELVIIATPYLVRPTAPSAFARPTDGLVNASDAEAILLGRLNRIYSANGGTRPTGQFHGTYGFIYD